MSDAAVNPIRVDVSELVQLTVASLYSNLVTRPTGRAVRQAIEERLGTSEQVSVSVIDFTEVRILDFSCADEVVAKLLQRYLEPDRPRDAFFLFRADGELHRHSVESVLKRQGLAAVCDPGTGAFELFGEVTHPERSVWGTLEDAGRLPHREVEASLGREALGALSGLASRRLVFRDPVGDFAALSTLTPGL